ncbi:MAG: phospholipid-binding protein [Deferrisomatales bacterium]
MSAGALDDAARFRFGAERRFGQEHRRSNRSPELRVSNLPAGVKELRVRLDDLDVPSWDHGDGAVASDGTGVVPAGALTQGYYGPCPPSGSHRYQFTVQAVDGAGVVVGQGKGMRVFP